MDGVQHSCTDSHPSTRHRYMGGFTPRSFYLRIKSHICPLNWRLGGPTSLSKCFWGEETRTATSNRHFGQQPRLLWWQNKLCLWLIITKRLNHATAHILTARSLFRTQSYTVYRATRCSLSLSNSVPPVSHFQKPFLMD